MEQFDVKMRGYDTQQVDAAIENLEQRVASEASRASEMEKRVASEASRASEMEKTALAMNERANKLKQRLDESVAQNRQLQQENEQLKRQVEQLNGALKQAQSKADKIGRASCRERV